MNLTSRGFIPWDNPDNILSQDTEKAVDTAVGAVCLPVLFIISIPCNILNMMVFWKQGLKERINLCLFYLSLVDCLYMISSFFVNVDRLHLPFTQYAGPVLEFIMDYKLIGFRGFNWLSGFIATLIASERCLCVVSPLRSQTVLKTRATAVILASATLLILVGSFFIGVRWGLTCVFDPATNTTSKSVYTSQFYSRNKAHLDVLTLFVVTLQPLTYITLVMILTIVTSVKLKMMISWREQSSSCPLSAREVALTRTLIAVSILYIVCSIPTMLSGLLVIFVPGIGFSGRYYNLSGVIVSFFELATFINATFNFFVYCILGSKYKNTLRSLFTFKLSLDLKHPNLT